jgi:multiple sugar transport system substrate-binding protein
MSLRRAASRIAVAGCAVLAATGVAVASAPAGASTTHAGAVVDINWETMWSGGTLTLLNQMVKKFNETHPGIHVTETNIPSASGDAKLESQIAAGDPPDVFTEWWPVLGEYGANGEIQSMTPYLKGQYAGLESWMYPIARAGGTYHGQLVAIPMSMNSWALYYNKSILAAAGIKTPPRTLAQLTKDSAKEWVEKDGKLIQMGLYPDTDGNGFEFYSSFFGATNCVTSSGTYDFASCPAAEKEMNWIASFDKYPYAQVNALESALGEVAGGSDDAFVAGKSGFELSGPWVGALNIPVTNKGMVGNFGVESFPGTVGGPSTFGQGNYNIIPKGAAHPEQAFQFIAWLAGYHNEAFAASIDPQGGWVPPSAAVVSAPSYQKWIHQNPWSQAFFPQMASKYSSTPALTPTESQLETAEATATNNVLEKTMTPSQALQYIDSQANVG